MEKFIAGVWKQLYSSVIVAPSPTAITDHISLDGMRTGADREVCINSIILSAFIMSQLGQVFLVLGY